MYRSLKLRDLVAICGYLAVAAQTAWAATDFAAQVQPILAKHCTQCHGQKRAMARLRLDNADAIQSFAKKSLLVAGKPEESELYKRIILPAEDKKRMPKGADPLSDEEIAIIKDWISEGAVFTTPAGPAPATKPQAESSQRLAEESPPDIPPASAEAIETLTAVGARVMPLFSGSTGLQVSFAQSATRPGDEAIAVLPLVAQQVVELNLSGAQASSAGYAPLAQLKNLERLHLEKSTIDDAALANLTSLRRLDYLNLYETSISDDGLKHLSALARLRRIYLWRTNVSFEAVTALQDSIPGLAADLGWDHPAVIKQRLVKQLEGAKQESEAAASRVEALQKELEAAEKARQDAASRQHDIEKELDC